MVKPGTRSMWTKESRVQMQAGWKKTHQILGLQFSQDQTIGELCSGFVLFLERFVNCEVFGTKNILPSWSTALGMLQELPCTWSLGKEA